MTLVGVRLSCCKYPHLVSWYRETAQPQALPAPEMLKIAFCFTDFDILGRLSPFASSQSLCRSAQRSIVNLARVRSTAQMALQVLSIALQ